MILNTVPRASRLEDINGIAALAHVCRYTACVASSGSPAVLVDQPAKPIPTLHPAGRRCDHVQRSVGSTLLEALVRPSLR